MVSTAALVVYAEIHHRHERERKRRRLILAALLRVRTTMRERNYLVSSSLIPVSSNAWSVMYRARQNMAFMATVSIPPDAYDLLLAVFSRYYRVASGPGKRGRPPRFQSTNQVLACLLHYYTAAVELKTLCELFGVPPATMSRVMSRAEKALHQSLEDMPLASVKWPSVSQQRQWAERVCSKEPLVEGCFCVADGKNYAVQEPSAAQIQNAYYNGKYGASSNQLSLTLTDCFFPLLDQDGCTA